MFLQIVADCTALSEIAVQHADDGYYRHGNFGGALISSMFNCTRQIAPTSMVQEVGSLRIQGLYMV